jgi:hypothetical protein
MDQEDIEIKVDEQKGAIYFDFSSLNQWTNEDYRFQVAKDNPGKEQNIFSNSFTNPSDSLDSSDSSDSSIVKYSFYGDEVTLPPFLSDFDNNYRNSPSESIPKEKVTIPSDLSSSDKWIVGDYLFQLVRGQEDDESLQEFFANSLLKTFSFSGNKVSLPSCLWKFHSNYFESTLEQFEYQVYNVSQESVQLFTQALKTCDTREVLTLETLKNEKIFDDLQLLANKYHVQWLINECNKYSEFFKIYGILIKEADFKNSEGISLALREMSKEYINDSDKKTLAQVAEKYQLADLHLFSLNLACPLPKKGLSINCIRNINFVIKGLDKKNSWHSPTLVLELDECLHYVALLKEVLNKTILSPIFSKSNVRITLPPGLNDMLMSNPEIKHLIVKIENDRQDLNAISEFIKGNTTLKSLHIKFHHQPGFPYEPYNESIPCFSDTGIISEAFNLNKTLQKFTTEGDLRIKLKKSLPAGLKF